MRFTRFSTIGILMAVLLGVIALVPTVFAANVTATVALDKDFVSPTGTVKITVTDADEDVTTSQQATITFDVAGALTTDTFNLVSLGLLASTHTIDGTPTISENDANGTALDESTNFSVTVFNAATGLITVTSFITADGAEGDTNSSSGSVSYPLQINFVSASKQTLSAKVTSPSDATGINVDLVETLATSGIFEGSFTVGTSSSDATDTILAVAGQNITVKYTDRDDAQATVATRTDSVTVEDTKPVGTLVSPADKSETTSLTPKLTVNFTDIDSLVDVDTISFTIVAATNQADSDLSGTIKLGTITTTAITNGFKAEVSLASVPTDSTIIIKWNVTASDKAGNPGVTDADASTSGDQDFTLFIDKQAPDFSGVATVRAGTWYDASAEAAETKETKSKNTFIGIQLPKSLELAGTANDRSESLDAASISAADFEIDNLKKADGTTVSDLTPTAANVYSKAADWIFLTVPEMAPDAAPTVILKDSAGGIADTAGNSADSGTITATDEQAPTVTATLNRSLDDNDATLTVTTNESGGTPTVTANDASQTVTLIGTNTYEAKIAPADGVYSIKVSASDGNANVATLGSATPSADFPESGDIALYIDDVLPAPTVSVNGETASGASVETSEPFFITVSYTSEGAEYGLGIGKTMVLASATTVVDNLDVHATVTIATVTLDDVSQLSILDTQDNITFNFAIIGISTGEHKLTIVGKDVAGNKNSTAVTFTVTARKAYKVAMSTGWNLISLPGTPKDTSIDSVLPSTHTATSVLTFDNGQWLVASRGTGGLWEGTLATIDGDHAYWVNTTSSEPVAALLALPSVGTAATLPSIAVNAGWNLVPVIDLAQAKDDGADGGADEFTASAYFTSIDWSVAYTYDASTRTWTRITSASGVVSNGQGVWVWADKAGTLIP